MVTQATISTSARTIEKTEGQYKCNLNISFWYAAAGDRVALVDPNPLNYATAVAVDGFYGGSVIGYSISNFSECFSEDVEE